MSIKDLPEDAAMNEEYMVATNDAITSAAKIRHWLKRQRPVLRVDGWLAVLDDIIDSARQIRDKNPRCGCGDC